MRFRTAIALTISLALAAALMTTVTVVTIVLDRAARRVLAHELTRGRMVFEDMLRYRKSLHRAESRVLGDEPRLKAVVATDDVTRATVVGVIADLRRLLRCDLLLMTDRHGRLLADSSHPDEYGDSLSENPTVAKTLESGEAEGVWIEGMQVFQVHGRRLSYGTTTVGAVVLGYRIDDAIAQSASRQIDGEVVVKLDDQIIASSQFDGHHDLAPAKIARAVGAMPQEQSTREVMLDGTRYLMTAAPLPDYAGDQALHYAIFRSLDSTLAPAYRLVHILYGITAAALALALVAAVALSRRLSRPIDDLVAFAQRIAGGDLAPVAAAGVREVHTLGDAMNRMVQELAVSRTQIAEKTRLAKELEIAQRIQTSILPRDFAVKGLAVTAQMVPASEVGGDYYDVIPVDDGCWIGIGDVAGHGLPAGMVMFMVQSAFAALVRSRPDATPGEIVVLLNQILFDNIRNRLNSDEHVTFTAARYYKSGRVLFAGAHEPIILQRAGAADGAVEVVDTPGTWLGVIDDISHATVDTVLQLERGDVAVLYSDGVTEAVSERREQLGFERLKREITQSAGRSASEIHAHLMSVLRRWSPTPDDDITLLVLRHEGVHE